MDVETCLRNVRNKQMTVRSTAEALLECAVEAASIPDVRLFRDHLTKMKSMSKIVADLPVDYKMLARAAYDKSCNKKRMASSKINRCIAELHELQGHGPEACVAYLHALDTLLYSRNRTKYRGIIDNLMSNAHRLAHHYSASHNFYGPTGDYPMPSVDLKLRVQEMYDELQLEIFKRVRFLQQRGQ